MLAQEHHCGVRAVSGLSGQGAAWLRSRPESQFPALENGMSILALLGDEVKNGLREGPGAMRPHLRSGRRGFLHRKWPDPRGGPLAALPGMGSHLAGPHGSLEWAPADSPHIGRCGWKSPAHPFVNGKGDQRIHKKRSLPTQGWPSLVVLVGGASSPKAGGAASASFWGPTPLFPIPLSWGGGHCFPQAMDLWNQWVTVYMRGLGPPITGLKAPAAAEETSLQGTFSNWRPSVLCLISDLHVI